MKKIILSLLFVAIFVACDDAHKCKFDEEGETLRCPEKKYGTVSVLGRNWLSENSNFFTDFSYCYGNDYKMCENYGRLYTWEASKKACPVGWRVPTKSEFLEVLQYGEFGKLNVLSAGFRYYEDNYVDMEKAARFWTSDEYDGTRAYMMSVEGDDVLAEHFNKSIAASVRCIQE